MAEAVTCQPVRVWNPRRVMDMCYEQHVVQDPRATKDSKRLARKAVDVFYRTSAEPGSNDEIYLTELVGIVVSHANSIKNFKNLHHDELRGATIQYAQRDGQSNAAAVANIGIKAIWQIGGTATTGLIVFFGTKLLSIAGIVTESLVNQRGYTDTFLAALFGLTTAAIVGYCVYRWNEWTRSRIPKEFSDRTSMSHIRYAKSKIDLTTITWQKLCTAWKDYAKEEWPEPMPAYVRAQETDLQFTIETARLVERSTQGNLSQLFWIMIGISKETLKKYREQKLLKKKTAAIS